MGEADKDRDMCASAKGLGKRSSLSSMISLSKKAGKLKSGEFAVEEAIKAGKALLVIVAEDASDNTKKRFKDKACNQDVPIIFHSTKEGLGRSIGKDFAASIAILDAGLARAILDRSCKEEKVHGKNESL